MWPLFRPRVPERPDAPPLLILHGLAVPPAWVVPLARRMRAYGRPILRVPYFTWTTDIPECAAMVAERLRAAKVEEFDALTHSTGGVILRWAMNHHDVPTLRRAVVVAAPNQGSHLAGVVSRRLGPLFPRVWGEAGLQLRAGAEGILELAGSLDGTEVGIIAGGSGSPRGKRNWFRIPGDNDGTVAVQETILPGMQDFVLLNADHTRLVWSAHTAHMANLFLDHGVFRPRLQESDGEE